MQMANAAPALFPATKLELSQYTDAQCNTLLTFYNTPLQPGAQVKGWVGVTTRRSGRAAVQLAAAHKNITAVQVELKRSHLLQYVTQGCP
jgi:hypothetical protein